jgi:molecular chaperone DnaK (HSP70)
MTKQKKRIFGIDLGTTYSSIAYVDDFGKPVVVPNAENQNTTPSVVFFDGGNIVVGEVAKESSKLYPNEVVSFVKRSMGEPDFLFDYDGHSYRAEEVSAYILRKLGQDAETNLGEKVTDVVITCPAYFGINEREATKIAGEIAGFNVRQIINEPTAAAIAYGSTETETDRVVLVYDLGGGTFDITMIHIQPEAIEVICTGGDHNLGGKDWDDRVVATLVEEFKTQTGSTEDILEDPDTCQDLQLSAERAKKILSQREKTPVSITHGGERVKVELSRERFDEITRDLLERTVMLTHEMLSEAKKRGYDKFDDIILVGGSTRMPMVPDRIREEFSIEPKLFAPDEAVAKGAAIFGWKLSINDELIDRLQRKTGRRLKGVEDLASMDQKQVEETARELADESGYTLPAVKSSLTRVRDVASKSFGVMATNPNNEEVVVNIILRNTPVPVEATQEFYTAVDNQKTVYIRIMEAETSEENVPPDHSVEIGTAVLNLPSGLPEDTPVIITFKLNKEGRLYATAIESSEQRKVEVVLETSSVIHGQDLNEAKSRVRNLVIH